MTKPIYSKQGLIAWLETQDPTTTYSFTNPSQCLIATYLKAMGAQNTTVRVADLYDWGLHGAANSGGIDDTYGGALARAKAELAQEELEAYFAKASIV